MIIDALGGAVARVAPDATAFPHRTALATIQVISSWDVSAPVAVADAARSWLVRYRDALRASIGTGAYSGYLDPDLPDWRSAYYGPNYPRLQAVKAKYDPDGVLTFAQGVPPP